MVIENCLFYMRKKMSVNEMLISHEVLTFFIDDK